MTSDKNKKNSMSGEEVLPKIEFVDGVKNWLIVMTTIFGICLVLENYLRYGIIKGPVDIVACVVILILQHWLLLCATMACYCLQIIQTFLLEKLLAMDILSEHLGVSLHALNVFFLPTAFIVMTRALAANPIVARFIITYILYVMTKVWSYAYINSTYRKVSRRKTDEVKNKGETLLIKYPSNITVSNIIEYFVLSPAVQYHHSCPKTPAPKWRSFMKLCLQLFLIYCIIAVSLLQFLLPELNLLRNEDDGFMHTFKCILTIALPTNLLWMLSIYVHVYKTYLPAHAALTGTNDVVFCKDWWNSNTLAMFWRKWNLPVHECLKHNVALPLLRNGYSKTTVNLVVFTIAGILHEFLNTFPFGIFNGLAFLCTLLEIPVGYVSAYIARNFGNSFGNLIVWAYLIVVHSLTIIHVFYAYNIPNVGEIVKL